MPSPIIDRELFVFARRYAAWDCLCPQRGKYSSAERPWIQALGLLTGHQPLDSARLDLLIFGKPLHSKGSVATLQE